MTKPPSNSLDLKSFKVVAEFAFLKRVTLYLNTVRVNKQATWLTNFEGRNLSEKASWTDVPYI